MGLAPVSATWGYNLESVHVTYTHSQIPPNQWPLGFLGWGEGRGSENEGGLESQQFFPGIQLILWFIIKTENKNTDPLFCG